MKKKLIFVVLAIALSILIAVIAVHSSQNPERKAREHMELAERYFSELEYEKAIAEYKAVIEIDPMSVTAYFGAAEAYCALAQDKVSEGDIDGALELLLEAEKLLENGINNTKDESLQTKLNDVRLWREGLQTPEEVEETETISEPIAEPIPETEEALTTIEKTVVDGIVHHAYETVELSEADKTYFDELIDLCESGDYETAAYSLDFGTKEDFDRAKRIIDSCRMGDETTQVYKDDYYLESLEYRILYRGYKIAVAVYALADDYNGNNGNVHMYMIPVEDGQGYYLMRGASFGESTEYGYAECTEGMWNGHFEEYEIYEFGTRIIWGTVKNGLLYGPVDVIDENNTRLWGDFDDGIPISLVDGYAMYDNNGNTFAPSSYQNYSDKEIYEVWAGGVSLQYTLDGEDIDLQTAW